MEKTNAEMGNKENMNLEKIGNINSMGRCEPNIKSESAER